ncbi:MAG: hypothetical protein AVO34_00830 [Firmicutes bacterium ML8_F2]|nr:MAG: hypothetical protein AVO34_00830 [Firmicutes bacterium ML8_F2]
MNKQIRSGKLLLTALFIIFVLIAGAGEAHALMIKMDLDELTETSDAIAYGTVTGAHSQWDEGRTGISTTVTFSVKKGLKGSRQGETVTIIVPGGEVDGIGQYVSDTPVFKSGEEAVLFLQELKRDILPRRQIHARHFEVSGNFQGKFIIPPDNKENTLRQIEESISASTAENRTAKDFPATLEKAVVSGDDFVYNGMRWYGTSPVVPYKINSSYETRIDHIQAAASTWNSAGANFEFSYSGTHGRTGRAERNNVNEIMWYNLNSDQTLALATVWYSGDRILENDMVFNTMFYWSTDGYPYYDVQTVALHEFGHWLSLGHSPIFESIMYYQNKGIQRTLHSVDVTGIRYIYGAAYAEVPVNDNFADCLMLEGPSGQTTGTNVNASKETGEPNHAGTTGSASVWWEWTSPANGHVEFNTFNSSFDTLLATYTGSSMTSLQNIASNDDAEETFQSKVDFNTIAGTVYKIAVDGWGASTGDIVLSWQFTPDPCSVTAPDRPNGPDSGTTGEQYVYATADGTCSNGHDLEYRFDLGEDTITDWDASPSVTASWAEPGIYNMRAQARCSIQTEQESLWSAGREVTINDPVYNLMISIEGEGTTSPEPGNHAYNEGTTVNLNAEPAEGWLFEHWVIDETIFEDAIQTVVITADMEATACFSEKPPVPEYILTISATGEGTTTPSQGSHSFTEGTTVQLTASPAEDWHFEKWIVESIEYSETAITITMNSDMEAEVLFAEETVEPDPDPEPEPEPAPEPTPPPAPPSSPTPAPTPPASYGPTSSGMQSLTINLSGEGTTIPGSGTHSYEKGASVNLTAKPAEGWYFEKWVFEGIKYTGTDLEVKMDEDKTATAHFKIIARGDLNGDGTVNITDITLAARYSLGLADLTASQQLRADLNQDGRVNIIDISILTRYTLGLIDELPAE